MSFEGWLTTMARIAHILVIVVISMILWGLPYGLLAAAVARLAFEAGRAQCRIWLGSSLRVG